MNLGAVRQRKSFDDTKATNRKQLLVTIPYPYFMKSRLPLPIRIVNAPDSKRIGWCYQQVFGSIIQLKKKRSLNLEALEETVAYYLYKMCKLLCNRSARKILNI